MERRACRAVASLGLGVALALAVTVTHADASITYATGQVACVSPRVAIPGQAVSDGTVCGASAAGFGGVRQAQVTGLTARAELTTNGSFLPESLTLAATGKAKMTVSTPPEGAGGYALSQLAFLFTMTEARPFELDATLAGTVGAGTYIQLVNRETGSTVVRCTGTGPCQRAGVLPAGEYSFFANAEQRFNSGGTAVGAETTFTIDLTVGAGGLPTPTPTVTPPVITWNDPAGGDFADSGNWDPPQVPTVDQTHEDVAVFELVGQYGVNVDGAKASRMIIRESSIDFVGGSAEVTSSSLAEPSLVVGQNGKLHLVSGAFSSVNTVLGDASGPLAEVDLLSNAPTWANSGRLTIGDAGPGRLTVVSGEVTSGETRIGGGLLGAGEAIVGAPGRFTTGVLGLGIGGGLGTLEIRDGGVVVSDGATIGLAFGSGNVATVRGADPGDADRPSSWDLAGELVVAAEGDGTLRVEESAVVGAASLVVGGGVQGVGTATVTGKANGFVSTLLVDDTIGVGVDGVGALAVLDGASARAADAVIGSNAPGTLSVADGSTLAVTNAIVVGGSSGFDARPNADGTLRVEGGALVTADRAVLGVNPQSAGHVVVSGEAAGGGLPSALTLATLLRVGGDGAADVVVENGARLDLADAAEVEVSTPIVGTPVHASGAITVRGVGVLGAASTFRTKGDVQVGGGGSVTVTDGALARAGTLGVGRGGDGEWRVGGGLRTSDAVVEGVFVLGVLDGTGRLTVTKGGRTFAQGGLTVGGLSAGVVRLDGRSAGQTGTTTPLLEVTGALEIGFGAEGAVVLDGGLLTATGTTTIHPTGVLTGNGRVTAAIVNDGGCFAITPTPNGSPGCAIPAALARGTSAALRSPTRGAASPRAVRASGAPTLVVEGDLTVNPGGVVRIELDGSGSGLQVTGNATFGGTLEVAFVNDFVPRAGDAFDLLDVLGTRAGAFDGTIVTGLPPGWDAEVDDANGSFALTVFGDYLCYQTAAAKGAKFPKGILGTFAAAGGSIDFGVKKPALLCNPSGPSTGTRQTSAAQLRGYLVTDASADPLGITNRALRVTNGFHPNGELVVDTKATTLALASAAKCVDAPLGACPTDLAAPSDPDAFLCAPAKRSKSGAAFPKDLTTAAVDGFGEARTYVLGKPTRVCAPTTGALDHALACYAAKPLGKACVLAAPTNATGACKSELDCGGVKKLTQFCAKQAKHAKVGALVLATSLARDRATTVKPLELCVPSTLAPP